MYNVSYCSFFVTCTWVSGLFGPYRPFAVAIKTCSSSSPAGRTIPLPSLSSHSLRRRRRTRFGAEIPRSHFAIFKRSKIALHRRHQLASNRWATKLRPLNSFSGGGRERKRGEEEEEGGRYMLWIPGQCERSRLRSERPRNVRGTEEDVSRTFALTWPHAFCSRSTAERSGFVHCSQSNERRTRLPVR